MLELITMSILTLCYIKSCIDEKYEDESQREKERIRNLKVKVFCYAVKNGMLYDDVVNMIQRGDVSINDLNIKT